MAPICVRLQPVSVNLPSCTVPLRLVQRTLFKPCSHSESACLRDSTFYIPTLAYLLRVIRLTIHTHVKPLNMLLYPFPNARAYACQPVFFSGVLDPPAICHFTHKSLALIPIFVPTSKGRMMWPAARVRVRVLEPAVRRDLGLGPAVRRRGGGLGASGLEGEEVALGPAARMGEGALGLADWRRRRGLGPAFWRRRRVEEVDHEPARFLRLGKVQLLSFEALHQLHIFIFVLAVAHVVFSATTMVLGGARVKLDNGSIGKKKFIKRFQAQRPLGADHRRLSQRHHEFVQERAAGFWRKFVVVSWMMSLFKQFYGSLTKSDYRALRAGFIMRHCSTHPKFDFHKYMMRALEDDFKKVVGIRWYLWLFVIIFLLMDIHGTRGLLGMFGMFQHSIVGKYHIYKWEFLREMHLSRPGPDTRINEAGTKVGRSTVLMYPKGNLKFKGVGSRGGPAARWEAKGRQVGTGRLAAGRGSWEGRRCLGRRREASGGAVVAGNLKFKGVGSRGGPAARWEAKGRQVGTGRLAAGRGSWEGRRCLGRRREASGGAVVAVGD
ncbi:hypothetical protein IEQ34_012819 [Dendrobium chrysotoxum]|uniref:MLO-like protein n=1 Tax=Dendrobium chrysotoxum TaxID=161865 RepID=A0AAV7GPU8_DENCH|nr:hypothetical protein IEQ34_012819 [Dendrobium chrysotoxum]